MLKIDTPDPLGCRAGSEWSHPSEELFTAQKPIENGQKSKILTDAGVEPAIS